MDKKTESILISAREAFAAGRYDESAGLLKDVLKRDPANALAMYHLGVIAGTREDFHEALKLIKAGVEGGVSDSIACFNLAAMLHHTGRYGETREWYRRAIDQDPSYILAINNLSDIEYLFGCLSESEKLCRRAIAFDNNFFMAWNNLGNTLKDQGRYEEAAQSYMRVLELKPDYIAARSNLLLCFCYDGKMDFDKISKAHREFGQQCAAGSPLHAKPDISPGRKLRIGFVSADFRTHSVAYFIEPVIANLDRSVFEVWCYSGVVNPDPVTMRLKSFADNWRDIWKEKNDSALAGIIARDRIDILVDLHGHSGNNRLPVFAKRPAPVQVTQIGYPMTTGLEQIDHRITDSLTDPDGEDTHYAEKLYRLDRCFLCYCPPREAPDVSPEPPCVRNGYITFGSFNNMPKIGPGVIELWAEVLKAVPNSRLMIKTKPLNDAGVCSRLQSRFASCGIEPGRLILTGHSSSLREHLEEYAKVDIALDTFPYNGTTTTCEAIWMGVSVVTLVGSHHPGRVGFSLLSALGLRNMAASSPQKYVSLAQFLARNPQQLSVLRKTLRPAMASSSLCNAKAYADSLKKAYLDMWNQYMSSQP